jgi:hypothetical protein
MVENSGVLYPMDFDQWNNTEYIDGGNIDPFFAPYVGLKLPPPKKTERIR